MSATADPAEEEPTKKSSKLPLILGLVLAIGGGAGGFFAVQMGLLGGAEHAAAEEEVHDAPMPLVESSYIPLDPLVINLPAGSNRDFLRFVAQIEVAPEYASEVDAMKPRIVDVFNTYLRAVEPGDLESPTALTRLRAQLLRRVQVVAGEGRVRDLLIMEFVLN